MAVAAAVTAVVTILSSAAGDERAVVLNEETWVARLVRVVNWMSLTWLPERVVPPGLSDSVRACTDVSIVLVSMRAAGLTDWLMSVS